MIGIWMRILETGGVMGNLRGDWGENNCNWEIGFLGKGRNERRRGMHKRQVKELTELKYIRLIYLDFLSFSNLGHNENK